MARKLFTVDEANALLPRLRSLLEQLFAIRNEALALRPEVWPALEKAVGNGGSRKTGELIFLFRRFEAVVRQIQSLGCLLKDVERGLIDFPSWRKNREVYLCWAYGEKRVAFWHDVEAGFAGRQPL
ncbi:MAG: DUF2203 domain-containing protein [Anaerolineae bacterium]